MQHTYPFAQLPTRRLTYLISFSPVPTALACFDRATTDRIGKRFNNGLLAVYESALAINAHGEIFVGADFVGGAGGVYRSTDYGDSWLEINHGIIQTDVRALAINASGHIFAGTYFGERCLSIDRQRWQLDTSEQRLGLWKHLVSGDKIYRRDFLLELQAVKMAFIVPLTMAIVGRLLTQA